MSEKQKTGTTTCAIKCKDGIVLAADMRATAGHIISHGDFVKIVPIADNIAITIAGVVSDIQLSTKLIKAELKLKEIRTGRQLKVHEAAHFVSGMIYNIIRNPYAPGIMHFLMGGVDSDGLHAYDLSPGGEISEITDYESSGSGSIFVYGVLDTHYKEGISVKEGTELAIKAISTAFKRDSASGNGIRVVNITKDGVKEETIRLVSYELSPK
jgi:proteasome beta subunit